MSRSTVLTRIWIYEIQSFGLTYAYNTPHLLLGLTQFPIGHHMTEIDVHKFLRTSMRQEPALFCSEPVCVEGLLESLETYFSVYDWVRPYELVQLISDYSETPNPQLDAKFDELSIALVRINFELEGEYERLCFLFRAY